MILRILTLSLYMAIPIEGEHIGGPLITFLILIGLFGDFGLEMLWPIFILLTVFVLLWTIFKPAIKRDKFIVPIGLTILFIPLIVHLFERGRYYWANLTPFTITSGLFVTLAGYWIMATLRART